MNNARDATGPAERRCRRASELLSRSLDGPLTLAETGRLHGHLMVCVACRTQRRQFALLREAVHRLRAAHDADAL